MEKFKESEILEFTIESLRECQSWYNNYASDLPNEFFNTEYYIIGTYQAKEWLGKNVFDVIEEIQEYENSNFGESYTDLSNPEKLVNMYVYIIGEEILSKSTVLYDKGNSCIDWDDIKEIIEELEN